MIDRIKNILLSPRTEWPRIDAEPMTERGIFVGWVLPLAAIGPVCSLIGQQLFGFGGLGVNVKPALAFSLTTAVTSYVLGVLGVWIIARIINALAASFSGVRDPIAALKVTAFSWTASWLAGVFGLVPALSFLMILGLYSLYLLYLGLPVLMKTPQDKAIGYTIVAVLCAIVVFLVIGMITGAIARSVLPLPSSSSMTITTTSYQ